MWRLDLKKFILPYGPLVFIIICTARGAGGDQEFRFPEIPGWFRTGDPQVFLPDNLYEHINGAADLYLAYDFRELRVGEYQNTRQGSVVVEIYRHASPEQAFGIYSQERPGEGKYIPVGAEGYVEESMLNFIQGKYYIKINGSDLARPPEEEIISAARVLSGWIKDDSVLPPELACFPQPNLIPHSEKYIHRNVFGYEFLQAAFIADYQSADQAYRLFIIKGENAEKCIRMLSAWKKKCGQGEGPLSEGRQPMDDPYSGRIDLEWKGNYIWGGLGTSDSGVLDEPLAYMGKCLGQVRSRNK